MVCKSLKYLLSGPYWKSLLVPALNCHIESLKLDFFVHFKVDLFCCDILFSLLILICIFFINITRVLLILLIFAKNRLCWGFFFCFCFLCHMFLLSFLSFLSFYFLWICFAVFFSSFLSWKLRSLILFSTFFCSDICI